MIDFPANMIVVDRHRRRVRHWRVQHLLDAFGDPEQSGGPVIYRLSKGLNCHKTGTLRELIESVETKSDVIFIYEEPVALVQTTKASLLRWIDDPTNWDGAFLSLFDESLRWAIFTDDDTAEINRAGLYIRE